MLSEICGWVAELVDCLAPLISDASRQGLSEFLVEMKGKTIVSGQSGLPITLPGTQVARIKVTSFFGLGDAEGATAEIISGTVPVAQKASLVVKEAS